MILPLVNKFDPVLKTPTPHFSFENPPTNPIDLAVNLTETMLSNEGIGLSAPQIGLSYRAFVIRANPVIAVFNPKIVDKSTEEIYLEESCLTFPGMVVKVKRPKKIKVRFTRPNSEIVTEIFDGLTSRIFQHQLDYLEGVLFTSRATLFHKEQSKKKLIGI